MSAIYLSVEDLKGEGAEAVCARAAAWGVDAIAVSYAYHAARDVAPHSGLGAVARSDGIHFVPAADAFARSGLAPDRLQADSDYPEHVCAAAARQGLDVLGWAVFLHNEALGRRHPEVTQLNAYGGRAAFADLCPSQPRVHDYCVELALAVAHAGPSTVIAESLHFGAFGHGYHHERDMVGLGPLEQFLLGLCFCDACESLGRANGIDVDAARSEVREYLGPRLGGELEGSNPGARVNMSTLRGAVGAPLADYVGMRTDIVTALVADVSAALASEGARLVVLDLTGAHQGYGDGRPPEISGVDEAWQIGVDVGAIARYADVGILAYAQAVERVESETRRYLEALGESDRKSALRVILRPGLPDCTSAESLAEKARAVKAAGAIPDFYHYGLYSMPVLDRIGAAT